MMVQSWTMFFNLSQSFPSVVMSWIRLPGLLGYMYKCKILVEIGGVIGRVAKLDMNTGNKEAYLHKSTDLTTGKKTPTSGSSSVSKNMATDRTGEKSKPFGP
ncbi:hypothetical protein GOBAR_AA03940 [Gossypium barbadense]|uniref:Uncharacterized protein n=1 Tax=Gossypium barbadense TaxID=3634 RepID=A0A2P5YM43_GOSBA|nr:hypothetical protein GOBAR_AA03940 [Gossypium barbadense]